MITIKLTEDIINVLTLTKIEKTKQGVEILSQDLFYTSGVLENILMALGDYDKFIPGTENTFEGKSWPKELEDKAWDIYSYITENLDEILSIVLTYAKNGVLSGIYKRKESLKGIWKYIPFEEE
jgi:hypothetical protein